MAPPTQPSWRYGVDRGAEAWDAFLTRLWVRARLRAALETGKAASLVAFQADHKYLFMAWNQGEMRALGRLIAGRTALAGAALGEAVRQGVGRVLETVPGRPAHVNALQHAFGYVSRALSASEVRNFLNELEAFRAGRASLWEPREALRRWAAAQHARFLLRQAYLFPYPDALRTEPAADGGELVLGSGGAGGRG